MSKLTGKEIIEILKDIMEPGDFAHSLTPPELGYAQVVKQHGGEGQGSSYYTVRYFKDHDVYIRVDGYYQSHYGTDFEPWDKSASIVTPKEKTITVYE